MMTNNRSTVLERSAIFLDGVIVSPVYQLYADLSSRYEWKFVVFFVCLFFFLLLLLFFFFFFVFFFLFFFFFFFFFVVVYEK